MATEVCIGQYPKLKNKKAFSLYDWKRSFFCLAPAAQMQEMANVMEAVLLQLMNEIPVGGVKAFLFEAKATDYFNELKHIFGATHDGVGEQIIKKNDAVQKLEELNDLVISRYNLLATAKKQNIFEFNNKQKRPEQLHFYVMTNFDELLLSNSGLYSAFRNVIDKGAKAGVFLMMLYNDEDHKLLHLQPQQDDQFYSFLSDIIPNTFGFDFYTKRPHGMDERYVKFINDFGYTPALEHDFLSHQGEMFLAKIAQQTAKNTDQDFIKVKIGEAKTQDVYFSLGPASDCYFALISGGTGSGKSTFLQDAVLSICEQYTPQEVQMILVDFAAVAFTLYRDKFSHIPLVFTDVNDDVGLCSMFDFITNEGERRKQKFTDFQLKSGKMVTRIDDYCKESGDKLPIVLVIFDELQSLLLTKNHQLKQNALVFLNKTANEVRKYGIYVILSTQSFQGISADLSNYFTNSRLRIGLQTNKDADFNALMGQYNKGYTQLVKRQFIINNNAGDPTDNLIVDMNHMPKDKIEDRLKNLVVKYPKQKKSGIETYIEQQKALVINAANNAATPSTYDSGIKPWHQS